MYFKLKNIVDMNVSDLSNYIISSSRNNLMDTLNKSMNSFFAVELRGSVLIREEVILKQLERKKKFLVRRIVIIVKMRSVVIKAV